MRDERQDTLFGSKKWRGGEGKILSLFGPLLSLSSPPKVGVSKSNRKPKTEPNRIEFGYFGSVISVFGSYSVL